MSDDLVKVALRIRPLSKKELDLGNHICLDTIKGEPQVYIKSQDKAFTYNYVFSPEISQTEFYDTAIKPIIPNIFKGFNVTILAYGQTGSGKTYSMGTNYTGDVISENDGIIPRLVRDIFNTVHSEESDWLYEISVSFIELYQEQLYDLLSNKSRNQCVLELREDMKKIVIVGLTEIPVNNASETLSCLAKGSTFRATGATAMNDQSSRSHAVFTITVHQEHKQDRTNAKTSKFHLVDLAGSERSKKTQATGQTFKEGVDINKGLLVLGNVISQLGEGGPGTFVNYRDSKLTRLLQDSLGGNSVTLMIACVSPADYNIDETLSTLRYADRARKIKNKPIINEDPRVAEVKRLNKIIADLQKQIKLGGEGDGSYCPPEHQELQTKLRSYTRKLNEHCVEMISLHEKLESFNEVKEKALNLLKDFSVDLEAELNKIADNDDDNKVKNWLQKINEVISVLCPESNEVQSTKDDSLSEISQNDSLDISDSYKSDSGSMNVTYNIDQEHEEHTLRQLERHSQVNYIDKQMAAKESLIATLLKDVSTAINHEKEVEEMEKEIKKLQSEKQSLEETIQNIQVGSKQSKIAETRRKRIQDLEKQITDLTKKCATQMRIIKNKEKSDVQIANLKNEIASMKKTKISLMKQMRSEAAQFNKWKVMKEREVNKLKAMDRKNHAEITRLQIHQAKQNVVYKRKLEESQAIEKKYKLALLKQKQAQEMREKFAKKPNPEAVQTQIKSEVGIMFDTTEAQINLQKLTTEKNNITKLLETAKEVEPKTPEDLACIAELEKNLHMKFKQILELEGLIKEFNIDNCADNLCKVMKSLPETKKVVKSLIETIISESNKRLENAHKEKEEEKALEQMEQNAQTMNNEVDNEDFSKYSANDLQEKLEKYSNYIKKIKQQLSNLNSTFRPSKTSTFVEYFTDDSLVYSDDEEKDPDWKKTPLFQRMQRFNRVTLGNGSKPVKRSIDGDIVCNCKTQCRTRICSCQKNNQLCRDCNCDPEICINRKEHTNRQLFEDITNNTAVETEAKKSKLSIQNDSSE